MNVFFSCLLIGILTFIAMILSFFMYQLSRKNHALKQQLQNAEVLNGYAQSMENYYEEFREFRHDYKNILATMGEYIRERDWENLQTYFQEKILPSGVSLSSEHFCIGKLHFIENSPIKSILYTKLLAALNDDISLSLEITEPLSYVNMDSLKLCRILGILLDNARESALLTSEKQLTVAIISTEDSTVFSITNSCPPLPVPISKLSQKGFTTMNHHTGLGLYFVQKLVKASDNTDLYTSCNNNFFHQTLEIRKD